MEISSPVKQLGPGPKTRVCYICGRQYGLSSYEIHLKQCKELWIAREAQKDPKDRKKLPEDPALRLATKDSEVSVNQVESPQKLDLEELNKAASEAFNTVSLDTCAFCGRSFLPEKLLIHNRSCTADNPARKVSDGVRKGNPAIQPKIDTASFPANPRPSTTQNKRETVAENPKQIEEKQYASKPHEEGTNLKLHNGVLVGNIGGPSGRHLRTNNSNEQKEKINNLNNEETIKYVSDKIEHIEHTVFGLMQSLDELKSLVSNLKQA